MSDAEHHPDPDVRPHASGLTRPALAGGRMFLVEPKVAGNLGPPVQDTPASRLMRLRMERGYPSYRAAARAMGIAPATYWKHETGELALSNKAADRYSVHFGVPAAYLLYGGSAMSVPIIGLIGIGGSVMLNGKDKPLRTVPSPSKDALERWAALKVSGDELWPSLNHGDVVFFDPKTLEAPIDRKALAKRTLCIVGLFSGTRIHKLRFVTMQPDGRATLHSHTSPEPERNVTVPCAAPVLHITLAAAIEHSKHDGAG